MDDKRKKIYLEYVLHKYVNGADIETACANLMAKLDSDTIPEHQKANAERKRILTNCLALFKDPQTKAEIDKIKHDSMVTDKFAQVKAIITDFFPEIFGADSQELVNYVITRYLNGANINTVCTRLINQIKTDSNPEDKEKNAEKEMVLRNCMSLLNNPEIAEEIQNIKNSERSYSLARRIKAEYFEQIFGKDKRTYNLSNSSHAKSSQKSFTNRVNKTMQFRYVTDDAVTLVPDGKGNEFLFEKIGRLAFVTQWNAKKYVDTYKIYLNGTLLSECFTRLNPSKLLSDESYKRAVIKELLGPKNLEACTPGEYIGEIQPPSLEVSKPDIGEQSQHIDYNIDEFRYRYSEKDVYVFDFISSAAVKEFTRQHQYQTGWSNPNGDMR